MFELRKSKCLLGKRRKEPIRKMEKICGNRDIQEHVIAGVQYV